MTVVSTHQQEVDALLAQVRAEVRSQQNSIFKPAPPKPEPSADPIDHRVAEEIETIRRRLDQLGDVLCREPLLLNRYGPQLQSIDLMRQQLGHLAAVVAAEDRAGAAERVSLTDLRGRLLRRPYTRTSIR